MLSHPIQSASRRPVVLLAEDDDDVRLVLAASLTREGYDVAQACTGLELYNHVAACVFEGSAEPDVIVADLRLPYFTGLEVLGSVRRVDLTIPFILITAYASGAVREAASALRADVLDKPLDLDGFLSLVIRCAPPERCAGG